MANNCYLAGREADPVQPYPPPKPASCYHRPHMPMGMCHLSVRIASCEIG